MLDAMKRFVESGVGWLAYRFRRRHALLLPTMRYQKRTMKANHRTATNPAFSSLLNPACKLRGVVDPNRCAANGTLPL